MTFFNDSEFDRPNQTVKTSAEMRAFIDSMPAGKSASKAVVKIDAEACQAFFELSASMNAEVKAIKKMSTKALIARVGYEADRQMLIMAAAPVYRFMSPAPVGYSSWLNQKDGTKNIAARKFSDDEVRTMRSMKADGESFKFIAAVFGVSHIFVRNVVIGKLYKDVK